MEFLLGRTLRNALLVSGAGSGRVAWGRLTRVETVEERRLFVTLIGSEAEVLAIRTRDGATAAFVPTLITTLAHAANID